MKFRVNKKRETLVVSFLLVYLEDDYFESIIGVVMELIHLGGERTVTGSCHLLRVNGVNILVDCGLAITGGVKSLSLTLFFPYV